MLDTSLKELDKQIHPRFSLIKRKKKKQTNKQAKRTKTKTNKQTQTVISSSFATCNIALS